MKKSTQVDLYKNVSMNIKALKYFGLWFYIPYPKMSFKFSLIVVARLVFGFFIFVVPPIAQFLYVVQIMRTDQPQIQEIASVINLVLTEMLASFKLLDLSLHRSELMQLIDQLIGSEFYCLDKNHKKILERGVRLSRRLFVALLVCASVDVLMHMVVVPGIRRFKTLPVKMDMIFFDVNDPAYFKLVCTYQILYKPFVVIAFVCVHTMLWAFMSSANSQLDVLISKLENMKELVKITKEEKRCDGKEAFEIIFKSCVLHHSAILRFSKTLQVTFGGQLSMTLFVSSCIIGTTAVQIFSIESPRKNITEVIWVLGYLSVFIGNLYVDCYLGNAITHKSEYIPTLIFSSPWLNLPTKMKRNLMIFIAKTQKPIVLTAAKLAPISMETFARIMNWTYKGFAVMNQMKK